MMSAGEVEVLKVVSDQLCGGMYVDQQEGAASTGLPACEKKADDRYRSSVEAAEMNEDERIVFDGALRNAADKAAAACIAETKYAGAAANAGQRKRMIACTSKYVRGGRLFDFDAKRGLTYEKLLRHLADRAKGKVAIDAADVEIPLELRRGITAARRIEGGFFSAQAGELFRSAMVHLGEEERAAAAEAVAQCVMEEMGEAFESYRKEREPGKRAALKGTFSRTYVADVQDKGATVTLAEMPAALFDPARLGLKGPVTASLQKELRRLFTEASLHSRSGPVLRTSAGGRPKVEKHSRKELADELIKAMPSKGKLNAEKLAASLRGLQVAKVEIATDRLNPYGAVDTPLRKTVTIVLEKRRAGGTERFVEEMANPFVLKGKDGPTSRPVMPADPTTGKGGCPPSPITGKKTCDDDEGGGVLNPFGGGGKGTGPMDDVTKPSREAAPRIRDVNPTE